MSGMSRDITMERMTGIEPAYSAWEADVLPLNYIRKSTDCSAPGGDDPQQIQLLATFVFSANLANLSIPPSPAK